MESLESISREVNQCRLCRLSEKRLKTVPGEGNSKSEIMFVGEGPGAEEDRQGKPFIGAAGKILTKRLASIGLTRDMIYITNIVKCRPPENRLPKNDEIQACDPYLYKQIRMINPKLICLLGRTALIALIGGNSINKERGKFIVSDNRTFFATYHPAAILRTPSLGRILEQDFDTIKKWLEQRSIIT